VRSDVLNLRLAEYSGIEVVAPFSTVTISNADFSMLASSMEVIQDPNNRDLACLFPSDGEATVFVRFWTEAANVIGSFGKASVFGASRDGLFIRCSSGIVIHEYRDAPRQAAFCNQSSTFFSIVFCRFQALLHDLRADALLEPVVPKRIHRINSVRDSLKESFPEVASLKWDGKSSYWYNVFDMLIEGEYHVGHGFPDYMNET
jgi:hypothetical protein